MKNQEKMIVCQQKIFKNYNHYRVNDEIICKCLRKKKKIKMKEKCPMFISIIVFMFLFNVVKIELCAANNTDNDNVKNSGSNSSNKNVSDRFILNTSDSQHLDEAKIFGKFYGEFFIHLKSIFFLLRQVVFVLLSID